MNRLRSEPKTHPSVFITLILAALVVVTGGVMHAVYKNSQVKTSRLIDQAEQRIDQTRVKIRMIEVNTDEMLDRFDMRERLRENGSQLIEVTPADIEEVQPARPAPEVASLRASP
jgi:predicted nucleic acid-binding protein